MPNYTENYNLKKPLPNENYNVQDQNDNMDIIGTALKAHDDALATKETPQGAQEKADAALASAKDYTDQQISAITPEQIGAETPAGAQEKANQAEANAKAYADQEVSGVANDLVSHKNDNTRHISANIPATAITFGGKFQIAYNSVTNSLDITVVG